MRHYIAAGSSPGRAHALSERPNQDAFSVRQGPWGAVAVVCDGCGSEPRSGIGAALGASMAAEAAARQLASGAPLDLSRLRADMLGGLALVAQASGLSFQECFLFTIIGAAFAGADAQVFACGDGVVAVDGYVRRLGPYPDNAPPYLAYALTEPGIGFERLYEGPAERVLIGTDGAGEAELSPFWSEERFLKNPDLLRRRLKLLRLSDDATVAVIIRKEE